MADLRQEDCASAAQLLAAAAGLAEKCGESLNDVGDPEDAESYHAACVRQIHAAMVLLQPRQRWAVGLTGFGDKKINVIKTVRRIVPGMGLKDAKELVEAASNEHPKLITEGQSRKDCNAIIEDIQAAGGSATILPLIPDNTISGWD